MASSQLYTEGTRLWLPDAEQVWKGGVVNLYDAETRELKISTEDGKDQSIVIKEDDSNWPHLRNPDILVGADDLTDLSYLHEPAVVHNLRHRFVDQQSIYTYCGIVLVAINPYHSLSLYSSDIIYAYSGKTLGELEPHIFAVAEEAFSCMSRQGKNQSIIVSGESGAGKTVSAKYAMRYFATVGGAEAETQVEKKVLASNPVMEAIGNAKTTRNDNSSRFGKYIEIIFNQQQHIIGAEMRTYLLEKSRVVFQAQDERNYHIFYQLCASADLPELEHLELSEPEEFVFTRQGNNSVVDNVDDAAEFVKTREALSLLGVSDEYQLQMFSVLAAVLHMGNLEITQRSRRREDAYIKEDDTHLPVVAKLLGIDAPSLSKWLTHRKIQTGREVFNKPQDEDNAKRARDALSKHIYAHVFEWIVERINQSLAHNSRVKTKTCIGVLDIYGFETFKINSFEQFCINWANEKLQQQFNLHVFKLEQDEYVREKIQWSFIDFYDNQPCIDLFEDKFGILSLLDEETKMPKGGDVNWATKMYDRLKEREHFSKPRTSNTSFIVRHYADMVEYQVDGFVEKNKDTIFEEHLILLRGSSVQLVADMFKDTNSGGKDMKKATVGTQFKNSLDALMKTLNVTEPHYVRCIKPNDAKTAFHYHPKRVVQQLRACGVLETIRISAAGYPSRWSYDDFIKRYRALAPKGVSVQKMEVKEACKACLVPVMEDEDKYQFGLTKIFFRAGQVAYLEKLRSDKMKRSMIMIQANVRAFVQQSKYRRLRAAAIALQAYGRGKLARALALQLLQTRCATQIQAAVRGWLARRRYRTALAAIMLLQRCVRGMIGRRKVLQLKAEQCAVKIQSTVRMAYCRRNFLRMRRAAIAFQGAWRIKAARKQLKQLKQEARSVQGIKAKNMSLEKKIIELQQALDRRTKEASEKQASTIATLESELAKVKKSGSSQSQEASAEIAALRKENERLQQANKELEEENSSFKSNLAELEQASRTEVSDLQEKIASLEAQLAEATAASAANGEVNEKLEQLEKAAAILQSELDAERTAHQAKIMKTSGLESQVASLQAELQKSQESFLAGGANSSLVNDSPSRRSNDSNDNDENDEPEDEYIEVNPDVEHAVSEDTTLLLAQIESLKEQLNAASSQQQQQQAPGPDSTLPQQISELQSLNDRLHSEVDELREKFEKAEQEATQLRQENKQLLVADVLPVEAPEGGSGSANVEKSDNLEDQYKALETELAQAKTDIKRLQLGNSKLLDKASKFEKQMIAAEAKLKRVGGETDSQQLREALQTLKTNLQQAEEKLEASVSKEEFTKLSDEKTEIVRQFTQLQNDYNTFMTENSMQDLSKAKTDLQEKNFQLNETLVSLRQRLKDAETDLKAAKSEAADLAADRKKMMTHQQNLEQALSKKLQPGEATDQNLLQEEVRVLIDENLAMREQVERLEAQLQGKPVAAKTSSTQSARQAETNLKPEKVYKGMIKFEEKDIQRLISAFVLNMKPNMLPHDSPTLAAHLIFMCLLYADHVGNGVMLQGLLSKSMRAIKQVVTQNATDLNLLAFWLSNGFRLLTNMKQFSGEPQFSTQDDIKSKTLKNFDLLDYRQVLSDLLVQIYHTVVKHAELKLQPMVVPALLESELLPSESMRKSSRKVNLSVDDVVKLLNSILAVLNRYGLERRVTQHIFRQIYYITNAIMVNTLLLRKDLASLTQGIQIRFNISKLEDWARDHKLDSINEVLAEAIQLAQLLQCPKSKPEDADTIFQTCVRLNPLQIQKMLQMYTPEEFESKVPSGLLRAVNDKQTDNSDAKLLLDAKHVFPVTFPFAPTSPNFPNVSIPSTLEIDFAEKV